ncbi:hypothetical protein NCGM1900_0051 [Pseudomonas aeruginosa]|nr:hypothetical protein NCGM1900_0051 [Pseudomonas aeruginosa]
MASLLPPRPRARFSARPRTRAAGRCSVRRPANALEVGRLAGPVQRARFRMDRSKLPALILHSPRRPTFPARPSSRRTLPRNQRRWTTLIFNSCTI